MRAGSSEQPRRTMPSIQGRDRAARPMAAMRRHREIHPRRSARSSNLYERDRLPDEPALRSSTARRPGAEPGKRPAQLRDRKPALKSRSLGAEIRGRRQGDQDPDRQIEPSRLRRASPRSARPVRRSTRIATKVGEDQRTIIADIAASAQGEASELQQVNVAINQMDQTTQRNAAMVEQSAAACHALTQEAMELDHLMSGFKVERDDASTALSRRESCLTGIPAPSAMGKLKAKDAELAANIRQ